MIEYFLKGCKRRKSFRCLKWLVAVFYPDSLVWFQAGLLGLRRGWLFSQKINGKPNNGNLMLLRKSNKTLTDSVQTYLVAHPKDLCFVIWIFVVVILPR